jgi:hypothetical protein
VTGLDLRILDAFPPPPGEIGLAELEERTALSVETVMLACHRLRSGGLVAVRFRTREVSAERDLGARHWQAELIRRLPDWLRPHAVLMFWGPALLRVVLAYRLTPDGLRRRFEDRATAPAGRPALEGG